MTESVSADLILRAKNGDLAARAELIERIYPQVRDAVHRQLSRDFRANRPWLGSLFSTGDVVHEVLVGVLRDLAAFEGNDAESLTHYLAAMVHHRLVDMLRHHQALRRDGRRVGRTIDPNDVDPDHPSPVHILGRGEHAEHVHQAMAALTARDRTLLELRFSRGATYPEIAQNLGYAHVDTARKAVNNAHARLLVALRLRGIQP
ncbi:MAG: sigma-70 family RNA polymerase sigma factor [Planctomycetota bacterium]